MVIPGASMCSWSARSAPIIASSASSRAQRPLMVHHERIPCTPTTEVSPVARCSVVLNQVPTTGTVAASPPVPAVMSACRLSFGAKLVMLYAQKIVLIFWISLSLRKEVGSVSLPSTVSYRSATTASDLGSMTMLEP